MDSEKYLKDLLNEAELAVKEHKIKVKSRELNDRTVKNKDFRTLSGYKDFQNLSGSTSAMEFGETEAISPRLHLSNLSDNVEYKSQDFSMTDRKNLNVDPDLITRKNNLNCR